MVHLLASIRARWHRLWGTPPPLPRVESKTGHAYSARAHLSRIEWKLDRLGWHLTRLNLIWPTSGPTDQICRFSTGTTTPSPHQPALHKRGLRSWLKWLPKLAGVVAEKLLQYLWPAIGGLLLSLWVLAKHYGDLVWQYVLGCWHWLLG